MDVRHLVRMANDIGNFFDSELGPENAPEGIASHIAKYWDPRMRGAIIRYLQHGGKGLSATAVAAVGSLPMPGLR